MNGRNPSSAPDQGRIKVSFIVQQALGEDNVEFFSKVIARINLKISREKPSLTIVP